MKPTQIIDDDMVTTLILAAMKWYAWTVCIWAGHVSKLGTPKKARNSLLKRTSGFGGSLDFETDLRTYSIFPRVRNPHIILNKHLNIPKYHPQPQLIIQSSKPKFHLCQGGCKFLLRDLSISILENNESDE